MYKIKRFIWKMFKVRNYEEDKQLTNLIYRCIDLIENCPNVRVSIDYYDIVITTNSCEVVLWNANKYYAWLCRGSINGRTFDSISPSLNAMYDFKHTLNKKGYNVHVKKHTYKPSIYINDVNC